MKCCATGGSTVSLLDYNPDQLPTAGLPESDFWLLDSAQFS